MHILAVPQLGRHVGLNFETRFGFFLAIGIHLFPLDSRIARRNGALDLRCNLRDGDIKSLVVIFGRCCPLQVRLRALLQAQFLAQRLLRRRSDTRGLRRRVCRGSGLVRRTAHNSQKCQQGHGQAGNIQHRFHRIEM